MFETFKKAWGDYTQAQSSWEQQRLDLERRKAASPQEPVYYRRGVLGLHQIDAADISGRDIARDAIAVGFRPVNYAYFVLEQENLARIEPGILNTLLPALWKRGNEQFEDLHNKTLKLPLLSAVFAGSKFVQKQKKQ